MNNVIFGITGSTGILGKRLVEYLNNKNITIKCLVRNNSNIDNLKKFNIQFYYGDIEDYSSLKAFIKDIDVCLHLAAHVGHADKKTYYKTNVMGTDNVCKAILEFHPQCKLVFCSSIASLRLNKFLKFLYTDYAISKYQAEKRILYHVKKNKLRADIVYSGIIYGPGETKLTPLLIKILKAHKLFFVSGGERNAPLSYIDDLCELFYKVALDHDANHRYLGIIKSDVGIHDFINTLAKKINVPLPEKKYPKTILMTLAIGLELIHKIFKIKKEPALTKRTVDVLSSTLNFNKYHMDNDKLDWQSRTSIEDGLNKTLEWINSNL
jgi:nucleoside-diphosphate-sugar epimerase